MTAIDISAWQHHPDFAAVKSAGVERVLMRAADGEGGTIVDDSVYIANRAAARAVGLPIGSYFFNGNATSPSVAAAHQWSIIDWQPGDIVAVDIEGAAGIEWSVGQALEWCHWMLNQGVPPILIFVYMSSSVDTSAWGPVWALGVQPWIAQYGPNDGNAHTPPSVPWSMWQYTSAATCPGILGHVDTNQIAASWASSGTAILLESDNSMSAADVADLKAWMTLMLNVPGQPFTWAQAAKNTAQDASDALTKVRTDLGFTLADVLASQVPVILQKVTQLTPGAAPTPIDYTALANALAPILAKAVNDDAAKRMVD